MLPFKKPSKIKGFRVTQFKKTAKKGVTVRCYRFMEMMKMDVKIFKANLEKLSKCKGLKQSDLEGKYKKAYEALLAEIWSDSNKILMYISLTGIKCLDETLADDVNAFIKANGKPIMTGCKQAVLSSDYDSFIKYCYKMRDAVKEMAWKYAPEEWDEIEFEQPVITD